VILTDREIEIFLNSKQIEIDPVPLPEAYSSSGLDLTLDEVGEIYKECPASRSGPTIQATATDNWVSEKKESR
jgi:hypothetical protein